MSTGTSIAVWMYLPTRKSHQDLNFQNRDKPLTGKGRCSINWSSPSAFLTRNKTFKELVASLTAYSDITK